MDYNHRIRYNILRLLKNIEGDIEMQKYNVAVVGATGLVGQTFLKVLKRKEIFL